MNLKHPLEDVFNMDEGTMERDSYELTEMPVQATERPDGPPVDHKDADDVEIEKRIDEVYAAAMSAFENQTAYTEIIEPRYAARNAEVAANYLNIALAAANSRSKAKTDRKRANQSFVPYANGGKTTNNIVIANREQILQMIDVDGQQKKF
jgi:hypothetical protein